MRKLRMSDLRGIKAKLFNLMLITVVLITAAFVASMIYQAKMLSTLTARTDQLQRENITGITDTIIGQVIDNSLERTTSLQAAVTDDLFQSLSGQVTMIAENTRMLFEEPERAAQEQWSGPDASLEGVTMPQMVVAAGVDEAAIAPVMNLMANMSDTMVALFDSSKATNSCFIAVPEGAWLIVDDLPASKLDANGRVLDYDPRTRPWYRKAVEAGELIFTDVEVDIYTGDIGVVCAMPVYVSGELRAVVGADLFLTSLREEIQSADRDGSFMFIVNQNGHVVFSPRTRGPMRVRSATEAADLRKNYNAELARMVTDALEGSTGVRLVSMDGESYYMAGVPLPAVGWTLITAVEASVASQPAATLELGYDQIQTEAVAMYRQSSSRSRNTILVLVLLVLAVAATLAILEGRRIVQPLNTITQRVAEMEEDQVFKMDDAYRTGDEIELLAESFASLSRRTADYVEQVRTVTAEKERIGTELNMAREIQASMLPSIFPPFPDRREFDLFATMEPAKEVGGDFYDFFLIDDDHLCLVMADVSGKGVPAALFMMISKVILQSCAMLGQSAGEILAKTNEALCSNNQVEMFVTVWLGVLEISTGKITAANAGHEYPILRRAGGAYEVLKDKHGFVVGGLASARYREYEIDLAPGDRLFVYTDGVPEAMNAGNEMFGMDRLVSALNLAPDAPARAALGNVREAVRGFVQDAEQFDDMTMLCLEYRGAQQAADGGAE